MATDRKDRGPKMQTKTQATRLMRVLPEAEAMHTPETGNMNDALDRKDRGTNLQTKTKAPRDREWPDETMRAAAARVTKAKQPLMRGAASKKVTKPGARKKS